MNEIRDANEGPSPHAVSNTPGLYFLFLHSDSQWGAQLWTVAQCLLWSLFLLNLRQKILQEGCCCDFSWSWDRSYAWPGPCGYPPLATQ